MKCFDIHKINLFAAVSENQKGQARILQTGTIEAVTYHSFTYLKLSWCVFCFKHFNTLKIGILKKNDSCI